jgi:hypothetical protein
MANKKPYDHAASNCGFTQVDGETYYRISGYDRLPPFLMSLPSDTDLWMFIASSGRSPSFA